MTDKKPFADLEALTNLEGPLTRPPVLSVDQLLELRQQATPAPVVEPEPFVPGYTPRKNGDPVDLTKMAAAIEPAKHPDLVAQFAATEAAGPKPFSPDGAMAAIFDLENQVAELTRVVDAMRVRIGAA